MVEVEHADQELFRHSLFLGIGMEGGREAYQRGDFLVRNIIGMDPEANALLTREYSGRFEMPSSV